MFSTIGYFICIPFAWLVRLFYNLTGSYGMAIILFTLVVKLIMLPFQMKSKKSMMRMSRPDMRLMRIMLFLDFIWKGTIISLTTRVKRMMAMP